MPPRPTAAPRRPAVQPRPDEPHPPGRPRRLFAAWLWAAAAALLPSVAPAQRVPDLPTDARLATVGLEKAWVGVATIDPFEDEVKHLTSDEDGVYVLTRQNLLTCFDLITGRKKWTVRIGSARDPSSPPTTNRTTLFATVGNDVYALDKDSGNEDWRLPLASSPSAAAQADDDLLLVGTLGGSLLAYDLKQIERTFREGRIADFAGGTLLWRYNTGSEIVGPPVSDGDTIAVANRGGDVAGLNRTRGGLLFKFSTDLPAVAPLTSGDGRLFLASGDQNIYAIDRENGRDLWEFVTRSEVRTRPRQVGDSLYVSPYGGGLYRVRADSGRELWYAPQASGPVGVSGRTVYADGPGGALLLLDREDGRRVGAVSLPRFPLRDTNDRTDRVVVASESGIVICLRETGRVFPAFHRYPDRRPLTPEFAPVDGTPPADPAAETPAP